MNLYLFKKTAKHLWRQRKESRRAFSGEHSSRQGQQEKDRSIKMYMKLFLLMGFTTIIALITFLLLMSWSSGIPFVTHDMVFIVYRTCNYLRGPLIFWFCMWPRRNVRKAFVGAFACFRRAPNVQQTASMDLSSMNTSISVTNSSGCNTNLNLQNNEQDLHQSL
jgi:hypothetical protein